MQCSGGCCTTAVAVSAFSPAIADQAVTALQQRGAKTQHGTPLLKTLSDLHQLIFVEFLADSDVGILQFLVGKHGAYKQELKATNITTCKGLNKDEL